MVKRKSLSKKLRFEIFKRDSFTCQYCGKKSPNVILEVDHIEPVSKGGKNDILNLVTSCFDCNRGKTDKTLGDSSVVEKQRQQLELLQERREQLALMVKWRKELNRLADDTTDMVVDYIEKSITDFSMNDTGVNIISKLTAKYDLADILESIDISSSKYLRFDKEGNLIRDSVEDFIEKIGGILFVKKKPPVEQKLIYIKGICRNTFSYWNAKTGSIILNNYVKALRNHGWSEERILSDLDAEVMSKTKESGNWSEWRKWVEKWTSDIEGWEQGEELESVEISDDEADLVTDSMITDRSNMIPALEYLGEQFEDFDKSILLEKIDATVFDYLERLELYYEQDASSEKMAKPSYHKSGYRTGLLNMFAPINSMLTMYLDHAVSAVLRELFDHIDCYSNEDASSIDFTKISTNYRKKISELIADELAVT